ncbi:MAG: hypothetical protein VX278_21195 [Myxococcota bacterium]|nr:hypothetical protein [Myxococcota bacterium]
MSIDDIQQQIRSIAHQYEFQGWFRPPFVRIDGKQSNRRLHKGSLIQLHLQPTSEDSFGSVGLSKNFQAVDQPVVQIAQELCHATCTFANRWKCVGELFVFARSWCTNHRVELEHRYHIGHRCFSKEELPIGWPYGARALALLRRNQVQWYNPRRMKGLFAIHPFVQKYDQFAGFAELVYVDENTKKVLGRDSFDDIGVW